MTGQRFLILSQSGLDREVDQLRISADAKAILSDIASATVKVGAGIIYIGRQVLSFIFDLLRQFPMTVFAVLAGFVISALIASVPFVGPALAAFAGPLLMALGVAHGAATDISNSAISLKLAAFEKQLQALYAGME